MEIQAIDTSAAIEAGAQFNIDRAYLARAVDFLNRRVIERRNTVPILSNIMIEASPCGAVRFTGNNLDLGATLTVRAQVAVPGAFTVSGQALGDAIRKADKGAYVSVAHDIDAGKVTVAHGRARLRLQTLPVDDFPLMPQPSGGHKFELQAAHVRELARVAPFASTEETKYYLNGAALEACQLGGAVRLAMVATDGWIMSATSTLLPGGAEGLASSIIGSNELKALLACADRVDGVTAWHIAGKRALVELGDVVLTFKLIDGTFPDWREFILGAQSGAMSERLLIPEIEPRLNAGHVARVDKVTKARLSWECGDKVATATDATAPDWLALVCLGRDAPRKGFSCQIDDGEKARAIEYLAGLAARYGLRFIADRALQTSGMDVRGMTCGAIVEHAQPERRTSDYVERVCYDTFTTKLERVETVVPAVPAQYADGSYSVIMPRDADAICLADATFAYEADGVWSRPRPLNRNAAGAIELSADAVRAMAGPVDKAAHVHIPVRTIWRGKCVAIDGVATADMPEGFTLTLVPTGKDAKEWSYQMGRCHPQYDAATMIADARLFDAIRPLTADELANPMPVAIAAEPVDVVPAAADVAEISPVSTCDADSGAEEGEALESAPCPVEAVTVVAIEPDMPVPVVDGDALAALVARIEALESALASRADPEPVITSATTNEAAKVIVIDRAPRVVRERLVRAYLRMRRHRDGARYHSQLHQDLHGLAERAAKSLRERLAIAENKRRRTVDRALSLRAARNVAANLAFDRRLELAGVHAERRALMVGLEAVTARADALQARVDQLERWDGNEPVADGAELTTRVDQELLLVDDWKAA